MTNTMLAHGIGLYPLMGVLKGTNNFKQQNRTASTGILAVQMKENITNEFADHLYTPFIFYFIKMLVVCQVF